jgi:diguanylate cyclase (GGDEF)-like protein
LSLGAVALALALVALLLASASAWALALWLGVGAPWLSALAAGVGVVVAALPLAWLMSRLARASTPEPARTGSGAASAAAGISRPLFMDLAAREWARARRYGSGAALLLVDVDRYARLCEIRGLAAGDVVLAELLRQTAPTLRTADVLTRFADGQMAVFLAQADATGALDVAERIRERTEQFELPQQGPGAPLKLTVSVGVAHLRPAHLNLQALIDDAAEAVTAARHAGGNCVRAAPVEAGLGRLASGWRGERRARPKQDGTT